MASYVMVSYFLNIHLFWIICFIFYLLDDFFFKNHINISMYFCMYVGFCKSHNVLSIHWFHGSSISHCAYRKFNFLNVVVGCCAVPDCARSWGAESKSC